MKKSSKNLRNVVHSCFDWNQMFLLGISRILWCILNKKKRFFQRNSIQYRIVFHFLKFLKCLFIKCWHRFCYFGSSGPHINQNIHLAATTKWGFKSVKISSRNHNF